MSKPLERLRHHVTGAIERGEAEPIVEKTPNLIEAAKNEVEFGDTVPNRCPKCDSEKGFVFAGWNPAWGYNEWHCKRCGYRHGEEAMSERREK